MGQDRGWGDAADARALISEAIERPKRRNSVRAVPKKLTDFFR